MSGWSNQLTSCAHSQAGCTYCQFQKHEYRYVARTQKQYLCMQVHNYATLACYGEFDET
jgi:hypothetical protein